MCEKIPIKVMIAGIGGASLGTEIAKSLALANKYEIYGCDISELAYGLYDSIFKKTFHINVCSYVESILSACKEVGATFIIAGGEQPMVLLNIANDEIKKNNIHVVSNSKSVIDICSNKVKTFSQLSSLDIPIPKSIAYTTREDVDYIGCPCIIKPSTGSGGSAMVFYAATLNEAYTYCEYLNQLNMQPIVQEYIGIEEGEFTVGVLSYPNGEIAGSIALQRCFNAKLSVAYKNQNVLISSGYTQGYIGEFEKIRHQCERIAKSLKSIGPLNIQGRVKNDVFLPFEINPRFSASTYLRSMAGFNEIDMYIQRIISASYTAKIQLKSGWYLRSLSEKFVPEVKVKND